MLIPEIWPNVILLQHSPWIVNENRHFVHVKLDFSPEKEEHKLRVSENMALRKVSGPERSKRRMRSFVNLMCSMSVHCIIRNNKHQIMHQNVYNFYSWKFPTCFDPAGPFSARTVWIHCGCVYTVKCECALGFILRLRGIVYSPRSGFTQTAESTRARRVNDTSQKEYET
jgi:hypothetical protein